MSYLPDLRGSLLEAAQRQGGAPQHRRPGARLLGRGNALGWAATLVSILLGLGGAAAVGVFRTGTPVGPEVPPAPDAGEGVAIAGSVQLLGIRAADPAGGPAWGLRMMRTTRGLTCLQLGRVELGTVGVLGEDGAFANDRRFHPLSANRHAPFDCGVTDANGNGFLNVSSSDSPASGLLGGGAAGGCIAGPDYNSALHEPRCPVGDLRDVYYGLLGPDATAITYRTAGGPRTTATGPDGAYLVVLPHAVGGCAPSHAAGCPLSGPGVSGGPQLEAGAISAVHYRDGHSCSNPVQPAGASACPTVGFLAPPTHSFTAAELAAPVSVRAIPAERYCEAHQRVEPCGARTPEGARQITGERSSLLVDIAFTSRVAIPDTSSYIHFLSFPKSPSCTAGGEGGPTSANIHAGERVLIQELMPYSCPGIIHGSISYRPASGPAGPLTPGGMSPYERGVIPVGRFSFRVP
jgi:hypothetical protein